MSNNETAIVRFFYQNFYPFEMIFDMLDMKRTTSITNRIIGFTLLQDSSKLKRYIDRKDRTILKKEILQSIPFAIHAGRNVEPMFNVLPNLNRRSYGKKVLVRVKKELVFDFDASDMDKIVEQPDRIRPCQCIKTTCDFCWYIVGSAAIVIQYFLVEEFGYKNILWVFSGNRGIHCWVNDQDALILDTEARESIINGMSKINTDEDIIRMLTSNSKIIQERYGKNLFNLLKKYFIEKIVKKKRMLENELFIEIIMRYIQLYYPILLDKLKQEWYNTTITSKHTDNQYETKTLSEIRWSIIEKISDTQTTKIQWKCKDYLVLPSPEKFIIFRLLYPQFDKMVTKNIDDHLLKLPFSIHHTTKYFSLPITFDEIIEIENRSNFMIHLNDLSKMNQRSIDEIEKRCCLLNEFNKHYIHY